MKSLRLALGAGAALAIASCSLLGSREVVQCHADSDCAHLPTRRVCAASLCVAGPTLDAGADADAEAGRPECTTTDDCAQERPSLCSVSGSCAELTTERCPIVLPTGQQPTARTVVFGVYVPDPVNGLMRKAVEQALAEVRIAIPEPPILAVMCKKDGTSAKDAVLGHLADLRIPLVVGQFESVELSELAPTVRERRIAVWSTLGNTSQLQDSQLSGSLYRFFLDELRNLKFQEALDLAAARVNAADAGAGAIKVAMISGDEPEAVALASELKSADAGLTVNAAPLTFAQDIALSATPNFESLAFALRSDADPSKRPNVVIGIGGDAIARQMLVSIEKIWGGFPRPIYLLSSRSKYNINDLTDPQKLPLVPAPSSRKRVLGVDFSGDRAKHQNFLGEALSKQTNLYVASFDHLFDATYAVAFAAIGADAKRADPNVPLTAAELNAGLALVDHTAADVVGIGSAELTKGASLVRVGTKVHFVGTTGSWAFDAAHVTRRMGTSLFCFKPGAAELAYYLDATQAANAGTCDLPP